MPRYRRSKLAGGVFFFTVTLADRSSDLLVRNIDRLREVYASVQGRHAFDTIAICILPDHLHAIWRLPQDDGNFPIRWSQIKSGFSRSLESNAQRSNSKIFGARREFGSGDIGNTLFAMRPTLHAISITFTSIRSSMDTFPA
jgi:putative transposase